MLHAFILICRMTKNVINAQVKKKEKKKDLQQYCVVVQLWTAEQSACTA